MILVTRLNGAELFVNPELFLSLEQTPDTVLTLTTGEKLVLRDPVEDVVARFMAYKRQVHGPGESA